MIRDEVVEYLESHGFTHDEGGFISKESKEFDVETNFSGQIMESKITFEPETFIKNDYIIFYHPYAEHLTLKKGDDILLVLDKACDNVNKIKDIFRKHSLDNLLN